MAKHRYHHHQAHKYQRGARQQQTRHDQAPQRHRSGIGQHRFEGSTDRRIRPVPRSSSKGKETTLGIMASRAERNPTLMPMTILSCPGADLRQDVAEAETQPTLASTAAMILSWVASSK
jgi:hypothetical protein